MSEEEQKMSQVAPAVAPARRASFLSWLLAQDDLSQARQAAAELTAERREFLRRAKLAFDLGVDVAHSDGSEPGSRAAVVLDLLRQSMYWALRARGSAASEASVEAVWSASEDSLLSDLDAPKAELAELSKALRSNFIELADGSPERQRDSAKLLKRYAARLIRDAQRPDRQLEWAHLKRIARILLLVVPVCVALAAAVLWKNRDLAQDMPWRTSSTELVCHPEKYECGGATTSILFHTKLEDSPWFEYDFGKSLEFSSLTIRNRTDYRPELAVPLVVEVSDDGKQYREIARRMEVFLTWRPSFATQHARYLRVRALNKTTLHLEAIKVHP